MPQDPDDTLDLRERTSYAYWTDVTLRYSDQDPMGHVNNAAYLVFFEASRVSLLDRFLRLAPPGTLDTVLARVTVDFLRETRFPGTVSVGGRLHGVGSKSVRTSYAVFRDGECLATAECVNVFFDPVERRSMLPPQAVRTALDAELGEFATG